MATPELSPIAVTEGAVRSLVRELFYGERPAVVNELPAPGDDAMAPISVKPEIDTSYRAFDNIYSVPVGTELVPKDKNELEAVLKNFLATVPDTDIPRLYTRLQQAFDDVAAETGDAEGIKMKIDNKKHPMNKGVEESIRRAVRRIVAEAPQMMSAMNHSGYDAYGDSEEAPIKRRREMTMADKSDPDDVTYVDLLKKKHSLSQTAKSPEDRAAANKELGGLQTRMMSHDEMAPYTGHAYPQGVKNEEFKTIQKAKFLADLSPGQRTAIVGNARKSYVAYLAGSGELSDEEVSLLKSHPAAVEELEGFRDWLDAYIMDAMDEDAHKKEKPGVPFDKAKRRQNAQWKAAMRDIKQVNPSALKDD